MSIGLFSLSLSVKDIAISKEFYGKLGLFQGMFDKNSLTFNPGWDTNGAEMKEFEDIRDIQKRYKAAGITLLTEADESTKGPASITLEDPDGNPILIDQHV